MQQGACFPNHRTRLLTVIISLILKPLMKRKSQYFQEVEVPVQSYRWLQFVCRRQQISWNPKLFVRLRRVFRVACILIGLGLHRGCFRTQQTTAALNAARGEPFQTKRILIHCLSKRQQPALCAAVFWSGWVRNPFIQ